MRKCQEALLCEKWLGCILFGWSAGWSIIIFRFQTSLCLGGVEKWGQATALCQGYRGGPLECSGLHRASWTAFPPGHDNSATWVESLLFQSTLAHWSHLTFPTNHLGSYRRNGFIHSERNEADSFIYSTNICWVLSVSPARPSKYGDE